MNILFFNNSEISPIANGIQRITDVLSSSFTEEYGYNCFSAFYEYNPLPAKTGFAQKFKITRGNEYEQFKQIIIEHKIKFIIFQHVIANAKTVENISNAAKEQNCKVIYCLHASPDCGFTRPNIRAEMYAIFHKNRVAHRIKKLAIGLLPKIIYNYLIKKQIQKEFAVYNDFFDKIVLLSERFIEDYYKLSNIPADKRKNVIAIPNILTFNEKTSVDDIDNKENIILIVSRLSERQKRISESLEVWKKVQRKIDIQGWKLIILGTGEDEAYYKFLVKKHNIKNVYFEGQQEPVEYYKRAAIYMMTSAYEGFPMVLNEAQQMGVVPIAFDSFGAIHDIIENELNGIIVEKNNMEMYVEKLIFIMENKEKRQETAKNALESCTRFSRHEVLKQWRNLLESLNE